jgi:hypothetical protein
MGCTLLYDFGRLEGPSVGADASNEGGPDGGADAAGPSLCDDSFAFCDGFENGLGAWTPTTSGGGTVRIDSTHVFRGNFALHATLPPVTTSGTAMEAYLVRSQLWPAPLYMRFFVYLLPPPARLSPTDLFFVNNAPPQLAGVALYVTAQNESAALGAFGGAGNATVTSAPLPAAKWLCLELEADGTHAFAWIAGEASPALTLPFSANVGQLLANLGLQYASATAGDGAYDAWFDEIAVDSKRVYCSR